jgi:hypothetical protein
MKKTIKIKGAIHLWGRHILHIVPAKGFIPKAEENSIIFCTISYEVPKKKTRLSPHAKRN